MANATDSDSVRYSFESNHLFLMKIKYITLINTKTNVKIPLVSINEDEKNLTEEQEIFLDACRITAEEVLVALAKQKVNVDDFEIDYSIEESRNKKTAKFIL